MEEKQASKVQLSETLSIEVKDGQVVVDPNDIRRHIAALVATRDQCNQQAQQLAQRAQSAHAQAVELQALLDSLEPTQETTNGAEVSA